MESTLNNCQQKSFGGKFDSQIVLTRKLNLKYRVRTESPVISLFFMFNDLTLEEITFFIDYFSLHFHLRNFTVLVISVLKSTNQYTGKYINIYDLISFHYSSYR